MTEIYLMWKNFIWLKDTLFKSNKFYLIQINHFFTS